MSKITDQTQRKSFVRAKVSFRHIASGRTRFGWGYFRLDGILELILTEDNHIVTFPWVYDVLSPYGTKTVPLFA